MGSVWELATQIADFRAGNDLPNATAKEVIHEIEEQTCARLHGDREWCTDADKKKVRAAVLHRSGVVNRVAEGGKILVNWLGAGAKAVSLEIAQTRADVCRTCDRNSPDHKWLKLTGDIVHSIAEQMQIKGERKMRVDGEENLHVCKECMCVIPLKIWLTHETLSKDMNGEDWNKWPDHCWQKKELQPTST